MYTFEVNNASKYTVSAVEEIIFKLTEKEEEKIGTN